MSRIQVRHDGAIVTLTFAEPPRKNAVDLAFCRELQAITRALGDVRAILLRAEGTAFSVGGDIHEFIAQKERLGAHLHEMTAAMHAAVLSLRRAKAPVIAGVNGVAAGGGFSLAALADIVIASPKARFIAAYTRSGLAPDTGLSWFLPRKVGQARAFEILALNPTLDAAEAQRIGLVTRVTDDVDASLNEVAEAIASLPSGAASSVKALLDAESDAALAAHLDREARAIAEIAVQPETLAKLEAFLAKTP